MPEDHNNPEEIEEEIFDVLEMNEEGCRKNYLIALNAGWDDDPWSLQKKIFQLITLTDDQKKPFIGLFHDRPLESLKAKKIQIFNNGNGLAISGLNPYK